MPHIEEMTMCLNKANDYFKEDMVITTKYLVPNKKRNGKLKSYLLLTTLTSTHKISNACAVLGNAILKINSKARKKIVWI